MTMYKPPLTILGIETSCDETAAAVVRRDETGQGCVQGTILSNVIRSQFDAHATYGGVVPEIAARAHVSVLDGIIAQAMSEKLIFVTRDPRIANYDVEVLPA